MGENLSTPVLIGAIIFSAFVENVLMAVFSCNSRERTNKLKHVNLDFELA